MGDNSIFSVFSNIWSSVRLKIPPHTWVHPRFLLGFVLLDFQVYVYVLQIVICLFSLFLLDIVLSVLLWFKNSDYLFCILWAWCFLLFFDLRILIAPLDIFGHGRVSISCSTNGTHRVNQATNSVISHEWGSTGKCLRQVEHIRGHLWHRYYIALTKSWWRPQNFRSDDFNLNYVILQYGRRSRNLDPVKKATLTVCSTYSSGTNSNTKVIMCVPC
jgi:hypothetical protein